MAYIRRDVNSIVGAVSTLKQRKLYQPFDLEFDPLQGKVYTLFPITA